MKKRILFACILALLSLVFLGTAHADYGYTEVSQIPMAVNFTFNFYFDETGAPHITTDYPFEAAGAAEMDLEFRTEDEDLYFGVKYTHSTGETRISGWAGDLFDSHDYNAATALIYQYYQNGLFKPAERVYICTNHYRDRNDPVKNDWFLEYSVNRQQYVSYEEKTQSQGYDGMGPGGVRKAIYYEGGKMYGAYVQVRLQDADLSLYYSRYGTLGDGYVVVYRPEWNSYSYEANGLFEGHSVTEFGFAESDLAIPPLAEMDIPSKTENIATSLSGARNYTVKVGEELCLKKSDFALYPADSKMNGRFGLDYAEFYVYGFHGIMGDKATVVNEYPDGDLLIRITPNTPGYYEMYASAFCYDEFDGVSCEVDSDYFMLTVLDEQGNAPALTPGEVSLYSVPSVTAGEKVSFSFDISAYLPYTTTISILRNGAVVDEWAYGKPDWRTGYTFADTGAYTVRVTVNDGMGQTVSSELALNVAEPSPLILKSLVAKRYVYPSTGEVSPNVIAWELDYEGGYGTKQNYIYLVDCDTGEAFPLYEQGFYPAWQRWFSNDSFGGHYYLRMNVVDDQGEHWITSNTVAIGKPDKPQWALVLSRDTIRIDAQAFMNTGAGSVYIPYGCTTIGSQAFAGSSVTDIFIPASVTSIADDALPANTVIWTTYGSYAAEWAVDRYEVVTEPTLH